METSKSLDNFANLSVRKAVLSNAIPAMAGGYAHGAYL